MPHTEQSLWDDGAAFPHSGQMTVSLLLSSDLTNSDTCRSRA